MQLDPDDVPTVAFHDVFAGEPIAVATRDGSPRPWEITAALGRLSGRVPWRGGRGR